MDQIHKFCTANQFRLISAEFLLSASQMGLVLNFVQKDNKDTKDIKDSILSTLYYTEGGMSCLTPLPRLDDQRMHTPHSA